MCVSLVGHSGASKTTTLAALWQEVKRVGPSAIGLNEFQPTEETANRLRRRVAAQYVDGGQVASTTTAEVHLPFEFFVSPQGPGSPANLLLHDVAGEQLIDSDVRLDRAPAVLWSDVILFFYNPEESSVLRLRRREIEQSVVLNGVYDDFVESHVGARFGSLRIPPLVVILCKSDLLTSARIDAGQNGDAIKQVLVDLGDGDVVTAAERWPRVSWHAISAQPGSGGPPQGVLEVFGSVTSSIYRRS